MLKPIEHCNVEKMLKLKEFLRAEDNFNFRYWKPQGGDCGTACCIAGHAAIMAEKVIPDRGPLIFFKAQRFLGLNGETAKSLFHPGNCVIEDYTTVTIEEACAAIDNVIAHNDPRWPEIMAARG